MVPVRCGRAAIGFTYNDTPYLYVYNATGDVIGIVDDTLTMVVEYTYSPWGEILSTTGDEANTIGVINPFRYRGYYYDEETELYYLNARYYDPETGRFISADTVLDQGSIIGINLFAYCYNNPVNMADSNGYIPFLVLTGLIGAAAGGIIGYVTTGSWEGALAGAAIGGVIWINRRCIGWKVACRKCSC